MDAPWETLAPPCGDRLDLILDFYAADTVAELEVTETTSSRTISLRHRYSIQGYEEDFDALGIALPAVYLRSEADVVLAICDGLEAIQNDYDWSAYRSIYFMLDELALSTREGIVGPAKAIFYGALMAVSVSTSEGLAHHVLHDARCLISARRCISEVASPTDRLAQPAAGAA